MRGNHGRNLSHFHINSRPPSGSNPGIPNSKHHLISSHYKSPVVSGDLEEEFKKMLRKLRANGSVVQRVLVGVMMTHRCTIALAAGPHPFSFSRSLILRPPRCSATMTTSPDHHLDGIFTQKRLLRSKVKKDLRSMDPALRSHEDDAIQNLILEAPWFKSCKRLCAYISCSALREVDTSKLLQNVLLPNPSKETAKRLYVPRVEDKNCHMRMLNISRIDDLIANSMNILEPALVDADGNAREDVMLADEPVYLLLLPGLAFDKNGRRLGRGGGYYDTFLSKYQELARQRNWKQPLLIALSYSVQIVEDGVIPLTPSDVSIDALVSTSGFTPITAAAREIIS